MQHQEHQGRTIVDHATFPSLNLILFIPTLPSFFNRNLSFLPSFHLSHFLLFPLRLFDARLFGLSDYTYDHVERTLFADYLTYNNNHSDDDNHNDSDNHNGDDNDNGAVHDTTDATTTMTTGTTSSSLHTSDTNPLSDHNTIATTIPSATTASATSTTTTGTGNIGTFTTSPHSLVKLQIGCSDTSCARIGWLVADARASLVTHFQLTGDDDDDGDDGDDDDGGDNS